MIAEHPSPDLTRPRALLADDDPVVLALLSAQLERQFSVVAVAGDADSAIALAREHSPAVAIVDVEMPGGGLHAARGIHHDSPATAVVILTADDSRSSVLQFLDAGAMAFLRKGMPPHQLVARLNEAIAAHGAVVQRADHQRRVSEDRFRAAFDQAGVGMAIVALEGAEAGRLVEANSAFGRMLGRETAELVGANLEKWTHADDLPDGVGDPLATLARGDLERVEFEQRYLHSDGHVLSALATAASYLDEDARRVAIIQVLDISERKRFEGQLAYLADHDMLTGLFNRRRFEQELDRELIRGRRYDGRGAVLALDLDGFKFVNDSLGHAAGDELVASLAGTMRRTLRDSDIVARTGGDEFAVILPESDEQAALLTAERLLSAISREGIMLRGTRHAQVTTSIGLTLFEGEDLPAEDLLVEADIAMYDAKSAGKNRVCVYNRDEQRRERITARQNWMQRLQQAIEEERFVLYAQPIVPVCSGGVPRFELLLRMLDEHGDLIPPGAFLYYAERFDLIQPIDYWVMTQAVQMLHDYHSQGIDISLAINVSGKTLNKGAIGEHLRQLLETHEIPEGRLVIEVTETAAIANIQRARELARYLRELGCRLALDDFGAGFATFYYLKHLEFDYIKIDGEFIKHLPDTYADQLVVRAVVDIARGLGADTIAEFVQDDETLALLRELGVGYSQGYHTGRPGPLEAILPPLQTTETG
jgi:diguanylate cyclase (GGDEF)-like protein/PAS domain S-box-containing protein